VKTANTSEQPIHSKNGNGKKGNRKMAIERQTENWATGKFDNQK